MRDRRSGGQQIVCPNPRGQQRLMRIAESGVRHEQPLLRSSPFRKAPRTKLLQQLSGSIRRIAFLELGNGGTDQRLRTLFPFHLRIAVQNDIAQVMQELGRAVPSPRKTK